MGEAKVELLEMKRRRFRDGVRAVKETARKLAVVGRLWEESPDHVAVSTDRHSLEFWEEGKDESTYLTRGELDRLPELVAETNFLKFEIRHLEEKGE